MNRAFLTIAGLSSASSLLLVDSAVKGTALLALAAIAALVLRRDSAATRHLVWLLAIVAMLVVPVLSATLPQVPSAPALGRDFTRTGRCGFKPALNRQARRACW